MMNIGNATTTLRALAVSLTTLLLATAASTTAAAAPPNGVEMIGVTSGNGALLESVHVDGGFLGIRSLSGAPSFAPAGLGAAFADDGIHGLQVLLYNNTQLFHALRGLDGTWTSWNDVAGAVGSPGPVRKAVMCSQPDGMNIIVLTTSNALLHTVRLNDGNWVWSRWGNVRGAAGDRGTIVDLACASDWQAPQVQIATVTSDGKIWNTTRDHAGNWTPFLAVVPAVGPPPTDFTHLAMVQDGTQVQLMASTTNGALYHLLRNANGSYGNNWGWVQQETGIIPDGIGVVQISASMGSAGAEFTVLKPSGIPWWTTRHGDGTWTSFTNLRAFLGITADMLTWQLGFYSH